MRVLLHICCAPCATYPVRLLQSQGHAVEGYFYNPNIHPFQEWRRRRKALEKYSRETGLAARDSGPYGPHTFFRAVSFHEKDRCRRCYRLRLAATAREAKAAGFDAFTSTLLISVKQNHAEIRSSGEEVSAAEGVLFFYHDFRPGWKEHWLLTEKHQLYKQQYCGCIYSEQERFENEGRGTRRNKL